MKQLAFIFGLALFGLCGAPQAQEQERLVAVAAQEFDPATRGRGYVPLTPEKRAFYQAVSKAKNGNRIAMLAKNTTVPAKFDCRDKGWVPPCWDQGNCGSCYLDSTVRAMTCAYLKAGYGKPDNSFMLAVQYGMDRPRNFGGCNGGNGTEVIDWACKNGWIAETYIDQAGVVHNDYPKYTASTGSDRTKPGAKVWMKDAAWGFVHANDGQPTADEVCAALYNFGALNIALDAGGQFGNGTGTITNLGDNIDHEILCVGYDNTKTPKTFTLNNQWSDSWGNGGFREITQDAALRHIVDWFYVSATPLIPPDPPPGPPPPVGAIAITPATVTLAPGATQQFAADSKDTLIWTTNGGKITQAGLLTATTTPGNYHVKAFSATDPDTNGTANFTVSTTPPTPAGVTLTIDKTLPPGTYKVVPANAIVITPEDALELIKKLGGKTGEPPLADPVPEPLKLKKREPAPEPDIHEPPPAQPTLDRPMQSSRLVLFPRFRR